MEYSTNAPNERVCRITQLAKLSFNHPSVVLTADVIQFVINTSRIQIGGRKVSSTVHACRAPSTSLSYIISRSIGACLAATG